MGRYAVREEVAVADCALEIHGDDLDDLFATAARAVAELMVDPATLPMSRERTIELEAPSLDLLLYDWLSELIFLKDHEEAVFPGAAVTVSAGAPWRLQAHVRGGVIDREHTALRADAKAVTFHEFSLEPAGAGWRARVVIDL